MSGNHYLPALPRLTIGRDHWTWTDGPRSATWTGSPEDRVAGLTSCSASIDAKRPIVLLLHHSLCCTCPIVAGDTPRTRDEARFRLESNSPHDAETLYCDWHDGKHGGLILGGDRTAVDEAIAAIERCRGRVIACTAEALFDVDVHRPDSTGAFVHRLAMADDSLQVVAMMDGVPLAWFSGRDEPPQRSLLDAAARALLPRGVDKNAPSVDRSATGIVGMHRNADRAMFDLDRAMFDLRRDERWSGQSPRKGPALEFVGAIFVCLSLLSSAAYLTIAARAAVNAADRARSAADELAILRIGTADDAMALRRLRNRLSTMQRPSSNGCWFRNSIRCGWSAMSQTRCRRNRRFA